MAKYWSLEDAGDQAGRVAVITGANSGLGYETALALAGKGARVVLACRNRDKANAARLSIRAQYPEALVDVRIIDTGSLTSVRDFAGSFGQEYDRLDLLINNAGIMFTPHFVTEDGFEGQLAVNYLGHFLLTGLLLPMLVDTSGSRVVSLYSLAANWSGIQFDDLQLEAKYNPRKSYSQSKLACLMFGLELNKHLRRANIDTLSMAAHPGFSKSDLSRHMPGTIQGILNASGALIMQSSAAGAMPILYAALGEKLRGGEAIGPAYYGGLRGPPRIVRPNSKALDEAQRARLWSLSGELCDFKYPL